jgi:hypothetical protein
VPPNDPAPPGAGRRVNAGRRLILYFLVGSIALSFIFAAIMVAFAFAMLNNGTLRYSERVPADLPTGVWLCDNIVVKRSFVTQQADITHLAQPGTKQLVYEVDGDCPVTPEHVRDAYVSELAYRGWTVHGAGDGGLWAYNYERRIGVSVDLRQSDANPNQTSMVLKAVTNFKTPDEFIQPAPR